jgi:alpha-N-arabinofuranosidase
LLHAPREIWRGTGNIWPEGPHLYRKGEFYYLLISEGGTSYGHSVTVARSSSPWGPFEGCPRNPILTHRDRRGLPIQATGHADLVELPDGSWAMVFLGIRPPDGNHHHLGRETFVARVDWVDGWPMVNGGQTIGLGNSRGVSSMRDDFDEPSLPLHYLYVRNPRPEVYSLSARPGWLRLFGTEATLDDLASPTFVGRRQQHLRARVSTLVSFEPGQGHSAGLVLRANEANHYSLRIQQTRAARTVRLEARVGGATRVLSELALPSGDVELRVEAYPERYEFSRELPAALSGSARP